MPTPKLKLPTEKVYVSDFYARKAIRHLTMVDVMIEKLNAESNLKCRRLR